MLNLHPTLIIHGEADDRCPIGQREQLFVTLTKAGCAVAFARYPGGSHLFLRVGPPEHREDVLARTLGWFTSHLGEPTERAFSAPGAFCDRPSPPDPLARCAALTRSGRGIPSPSERGRGAPTRMGGVRTPFPRREEGTSPQRNHAGLTEHSRPEVTTSGLLHVTRSDLTA